jgi:hypothetical protein
MHTVQLLEAALDTARSLGYEVRLEWLGGSGGGDCEIQGRRYLFVDVAQSPAEQLEHVTSSLARITQAATLPIRLRSRPLPMPRKMSA